MEIVSRRDGRVVDSSGLENRHSFQKLSRVRIPLSPFPCEMFLSLVSPCSIKYKIKKKGSARYHRIAEPEKKQERNQS